MVYGGFLSISSILGALYIFLPPDSLVIIYLLNFILTFFFGVVSVLQWAMYTDTADYGEWKFGRRATGLIMAASLFTLKLGLTLGGAIIGWVLAANDFVPNITQTSESMNGILLLISVLPAIFGLTGGALMIFYPLTNNMMIKIEDDLAARKQQI